MNNSVDAPATRVDTDEELMNQPMDLKNITENAVPKDKGKENMKERLRQNIE